MAVYGEKLEEAPAGVLIIVDLTLLTRGDKLTLKYPIGVYSMGKKEGKQPWRREI